MLNASDPYVSGMYIRSIKISDFRCFRSASISFLVPEGKGSSKLTYPNVNLILGTNASGKSAVLKALALSVLAPALSSSGFVPNLLVRRPSQGEKKIPQRAEATSKLQLYIRGEGGKDETAQTHGQIILERKGDNDLIVSTAIVDERLWQSIYENHHLGFFLVAYGATRRVEIGDVDLSLRDRHRTPRYQRVSGLFEDYVALTPPATWVKQLDSLGRLDEAVELLTKVMPSEVRPIIERPPSASPQVNYNAAGTMLPFVALADGYRAFIGWVGDLLFNLGSIATEGMKMTDVRGVVIVDEIDLHLHPEWQRIVVDRISKTFPKIQFFLTTHSPLVTSSLEAKNVMRCEIDEKGVRKVVHTTEDPHGLSPDQILTSDLFGMMSVRPEPVEKALHEIAKNAIDGDPKAAIEYLKVLRGKERDSELL